MAFLKKIFKKQQPAVNSDTTNDLIQKIIAVNKKYEKPIADAKADLEYWKKEIEKQKR